MARADLPGGAWVEYRDRLTAGDKFHVMSAFKVTSNEDGQSEFPSGVVNLFRNALLELIVTAWGGPGLDGLALPGTPGVDCEEILGNLDLDTYNALADAVEPLLAKVVKTGPNQPGRKKTPASSSG